MLSPASQIKERLSIVDVVSSYIKLEKAGSNYKARCPFHNEKSASFFVSPARNTYHCFGCSRGGDIFTFTEDIEGVTFAEALKTLADRAGIKITKANFAENMKQGRSYEMLEMATKFFEYCLTKHPEVLEYLKKRGLADETIKNFRIGFSLDGWQNLETFLKSKGFDEKLMAENGLIIKGERGYYDRFRNRIMFPIADSQGRVVGFSGRIFALPSVALAKEGSAIEPAKYMNSPETDLYKKSEILYGYNLAKRSIMQENFAVLVEGQMDLVMAHQAGTANSVAVSGTALTERHIELIKRFTDKILLGFDADPAGLKASERGVGMALSLGMDVRIIKIPADLDPADLILKDKALWQDAIKQAKHIVDFYLDHLASQNLDIREFRLEASRKVLPYIAQLSNKIDQAHFIKEISKQIDLPEESIRQEIEKIILNQKKEIQGLPVKMPEADKKIRSMKNQIEEKIFGIYLWSLENKELKIKPEDLASKYNQITGLDLKEEAGKIGQKESQDLIFQAEMNYQDEKILKDETVELLDNFEKEFLEEKLSELMQEMRRAEQKKDDSTAEEILKKCHEISSRINEIKNQRFLEK